MPDYIEELLPSIVWSHFLGKAVGILASSFGRQIEHLRMYATNNFAGATQVHIFLSDFAPGQNVKITDETIRQAVETVGLSPFFTVDRGRDVDSHGVRVEIWAITFKLLRFNDLDQSAFHEGFSTEMSSVKVEFL